MRRVHIDRTLAIEDPILAPHFQGRAYQQVFSDGRLGGEIDVRAVSFEPAARTMPHTHEHEQTLYIISGEGIVATETEQYRVAPGDVITIAAHAWHWHGAVRTSPLCFLSVMLVGSIDWNVPLRHWAEAGE